MKTLLPNTKFYNFSRKFRQVTALSWTFFGGGQKFHWGAQHQHHVTTSLMKLAVGERNVATNLGIITGCVKKYYFSIQTKAIYQSSKLCCTTLIKWVSNTRYRNLSLYLFMTKKSVKLNLSIINSVFVTLGANDRFWVGRNRSDLRMQRMCIQVVAGPDSRRRVWSWRRVLVPKREERHHWSATSQPSTALRHIVPLFCLR